VTKWLANEVRMSHDRPDHHPPAVELTNLRVVAIDGGTGTGKSRLGTELAQLLRTKGVPALFVSTGHLYRAVGYVALQQAKGDAARVRIMTEPQMVALARKHDLQMHGGVVWIDGQPADVDTQLKGPGVGAVTPHGAGFLGVRQIVDAAARRQINEFEGYVLMEGRDIGHGVVPEAPLRLLLVVSPEVAAQRSVEHTVEEIRARDVTDRAHKFGALKHPDEPHDYHYVLPTDEHTPESIRDHVYGLMREVFPTLPERD
jgi:cytidylate kinase